MNESTPIVDIPTEAERLDSMVPDPGNGIVDGDIVTSPAHEEDKIVFDYNDANELIGWHKENITNG